MFTDNDFPTYEADNPSTHIRCQCGKSYYDFDNDPCLACNCEFYREYERDKHGYIDEDDEFDEFDEIDSVE